MDTEYLKREGLQLLWLIIYIAFVCGILTLFIGFGAGGFEKEEILGKNNFYLGYAALLLLGVVACKIVGLFIFGKKDEDIEGAISHDPEQSLLGNLRILRNPFLLTFFCIIIFSLLGWLASINQEFFGKFYGLGIVPEYSQQFTKGADIFFSMYPASPTETLGAIFLISLVGIVLGVLVKKEKLSKTMFNILFIPIGTFFCLVYGLINHALRYGFSQVAMSSVAFFWTLGGLLTTLSGSFIPFLIMHDINNFYYKFAKLFSSTIVTGLTFAVIGIMIGVFLIVYFKRRAKRKNATS